MRLAPLGFHIFQVYLLLVLVLWVKSMLVNPPLSPVSPDIFDIPISIYRLSFGPGHVVANLKLAWNPRLQVNP